MEGSRINQHVPGEQSGIEMYFFIKKIAPATTKNRQDVMTQFRHVHEPAVNYAKTLKKIISAKGNVSKKFNSKKRSPVENKQSKSI